MHVLIGWESSGSEETVHTCGDGTRPAGEEPVQGAAAGATGKCPMDGNDPSGS